MGKYALVAVGLALTSWWLHMGLITMGIVIIGGMIIYHCGLNWFRRKLGMKEHIPKMIQAGQKVWSWSTFWGGRAYQKVEALTSNPEQTGYDASWAHKEPTTIDHREH